MGTSMGEVFAILFMVIVVLLLLFLIMREIMMWYWKINHRLDALMTINRSLFDVNKNLAEIKAILASQSSTIASRPDLLNGLDLPVDRMSDNLNMQEPPMPRREVRKPKKADDDQLPEL